MTDQSDKGSGSSLSFEHVRDMRRSEHAKAGSEPVADHAVNLAFEAAPRMPPPPPPPAPGDAQAAAAATSGPGHGTPAFEAVPISVGAPPQQRLSTATVGFRPPPATVAAGVSGPGGSGWNIRRQQNPFGGDRSAWDTPLSPRRRRSSRILTAALLAAVVIVALAFAALVWGWGKPHASVKITTPSSVGSLGAINTPATAAVTQEMEKVMLAAGATLVMDVSGQPVNTTLHEAVAARSAGES